MSIYKINIQKPIVFLCTNNKPVGSKTKNTIPFITTPKEIKLIKLDINITKHV